jgi:hypothetical protein
MTRSEFRLAVAAAVLCFGPAAGAGLIAYEPFDYAAATDLLGASGGTRFQGTRVQSSNARKRTT